MTLGGGVLNCWAKKQKSVALSSWESELFAAITSGTRSLGIQSELMDLGYSCKCHSCDRQSECHRSLATPWPQCCFKARWSEGALAAGSSRRRKLELEKVDTAMNPADVLPGSRIRELCRLARVYICCSEGDMGDDPDEWYLSRLDELCRRERENRTELRR